MKEVARLAAYAAFGLIVGSPSTHAMEPRGVTQVAQTQLPAPPPARPAPARGSPGTLPAASAAPAPAAPPTGPEHSPPAQAAQAQAPAQQIPSRTEILNFDNWVVTCNEFADKPKTRVCSALLRIVQQNTNQTVFVWSLTMDSNKQMVSTLQTPTGVYIAPGVELRVGKAPPRKIAFTSCDTGGCVAPLLMDANTLREMVTAPTAEAIIQGTGGNTVQFNVQLKGIDKAYAALSGS
jgi:invasion protein IalB